MRNGIDGILFKTALEGTVEELKQCLEDGANVNCYVRRDGSMTIAESKEEANKKLEEVYAEAERRKDEDKEKVYEELSQKIDIIVEEQARSMKLPGDSTQQKKRLAEILELKED